MFNKFTVPNNPFKGLFSSIKESKVKETNTMTTNARKESQLSPKEREQMLYDYLTKQKGYDLITTAILMAQCKHETDQFRTMVEYGSKAYFKKYDGRKDLGNIYPGDGERFRGRGWIQITGRTNYTNFSKAKGIPLTERPELAEHEDIALEVLDWFINHGNKYRDGTNVLYWAQRGDVLKATKLINGGTNALSERKKYFEDYKRRFGI